MKLFKTAMLVILGIFSFCSVSFSHTLWLNSTNYTPTFYERFGAFSRVYFGWGHRYPADGFLDKEDLVQFNLVSPDMTSKEITPGKGGFLATEINMKEKGAYWVEAVKKSGFYTMYDVNGKIKHGSGPMDKNKNVILSLFYQEFTKALINVEKGMDKNLSKPLGHKIEFIPMENPLNLGEGDILPVKLLLDGKPARYVKVFGTYNGFTNEDDFAFATTTNKDGVAKIRLLKRGNWLLKANKKLAPDDKLQGKCLNESYTATLTFEIK